MSEVLNHIPTFMNLRAELTRRPRVERSAKAPAAKRNTNGVTENNDGVSIEVIKQPELYEELRLDELWYQSWRSLGTRDDGQATFEMLLSLHNEPTRRVHTAQHLLDCFAMLKRWHKETQFFHQLAMGIWFHDALYDAQRHDNEARSARLASERLSAAKVMPDNVQRIRDLIISTRPGEQLQSREARLLHDIDRAVFGADAETYNRYERHLRYEQLHIGDFIYRRKRIEQLQALLGKSQLYLTDSAQTELQTAATANLKRWLDLWQASDLAVAPEVRVESVPGHVI
jgi:predicted metal-dependent HD superfamily phosphohydrolase